MHNSFPCPCTVVAQLTLFLGHLNLKVAEVDQNLYKRLFYSNSIEIDKARFQQVSQEEVSNFMKKFVGQPLDLLSKEQQKHYFGNLKASEVDQFFNMIMNQSFS